MSDKNCFHLHLVSDATGETISTVIRACLAQFEDVETVEHVWSLVRTPGQIKRVLAGVDAHPGVVLVTIVNPELRELLEHSCTERSVPCVFVLDDTMTTLKNFLGRQSQNLPGQQHMMNASYFKRMEAIDYTLSHDDGQLTDHLFQADVIILGVSRTSKTPTCLYLANRGVKAANVPLVPEVPPPEALFKVNGPLIICLTMDPKLLVQIRRNRLSQISGQDDPVTNYVDFDMVKQEVAQARRFAARHGWTVIDVSRRSVEETAATIFQHYQNHLENKAAVASSQDTNVVIESTLPFVKNEALNKNFKG